LISVFDGFYDTLNSCICQTVFRRSSFVLWGNLIYFLLFLHQKSFIRAKLRAKRSHRARFSSFSFRSYML